MTSFFIRPLAAALLLLFLASCACPLAQQSDNHLQHVVLLWLKQPGDKSQQQVIIEACESFRAIPAVQSVRVGTTLPSDRDIVDDSFDVALIVTTEDASGLKEYIDHPIHTSARDEILLPLIDKVVVYDFQR